MKYLNRFFSDSKQLARIVIYAGIALVLLVVSFGTYYYRDRYVSPVDQVSPNQKTITELEKKIRKEPQNADLRLTLAEAYLGVQNYDAAIQQAQEVIKSYPDKDGALFILGFSHASLQQFDQAIVPLTEFVKVREASEMADADPLLETALYFLGESYIQTGKPQDAIAPLTRALEINKTDADAMYNEALKYYEKAIQFVPDFADAYSGMSQSYDALGQTDKAAYARGMLAYSINDLETARQELEQTVTKMPDYGPAIVGLALTYEKLGDLVNAKLTVENALVLDPNNFLAQQLLGRIEAAQQ
jgi:tetratricopeptide (TPR) repeat protein